MISTLATKKNSFKKKNINKRMGIIVFKTLKPKNVFFGISRNQQLFDFDFVQKPKTQ